MDKLVDRLMDYGALGIMIIVCFFVIRILWNQKTKEQLARDKEDERIKAELARNSEENRQQIVSLQQQISELRKEQITYLKEDRTELLKIISENSRLIQTHFNSKQNVS